MFSEAISSISCCCRPSSPRIAAAISGSAVASEAVKNESGAALEELALEVLALVLIGEYPHRPNLLGGLRAVLEWRVESCVSRLAHRSAPAKDLRSPPDFYARYGGRRYRGRGNRRARSVGATIRPAPAAPAPRRAGTAPDGWLSHRPV